MSVKNNFFQRIGKAKVIIEGVNFDRLLNDIVTRQIKIIEVARQNNILILTISCSFLAQLIALLKEKCYTFTIQKQSGIANFFDVFITRWGLFLGFLISVSVFGFASCFVWGIVVENDEAQLQQTFNKILAENNLGVGVLRFNQSSYEIEQCLLDNIPELSLVSASFKGTNIIVNYTLQTEKEEMLEQQKKVNIVATNDGIVTSISVTSGTALVKVGDVVKKGQILIAGYKIVEEEQVECVASGTVYANVFKSATIQFPLKTIQWVRTGNFLTGTEIKLFNKTISNNQPDVNFEHYETIITYEKYNLLIPLEFYVTRYYEVESVEIEQDFESSKESIIAQSRLLALEQCSAVDNIIDESYDVNFVSDVWFVTYNIKIKEKIS